MSRIYPKKFKKKNFVLSKNTGHRRTHHLKPGTEKGLVGFDLVNTDNPPCYAGTGVKTPVQVVLYI